MSRPARHRAPSEERRGRGGAGRHGRETLLVLRLIPAAAGAVVGGLALLLAVLLLQWLDVLP